MEPSDWTVIIFKLTGLGLVFFGFRLELMDHPWAWVWAALAVLIGLAFLQGE